MKELLALINEDAIYCIFLVFTVVGVLLGAIVYSVLDLLIWCAGLVRRKKKLMQAQLAEKGIEE